KIQNRDGIRKPCVNISIISNEVNGTKLGDGILVYNSEGSKVFAEKVIISENHLKNIAQDGVNLRITKNAKIVNNKIENTARSGIYLRENYKLNVSNNNIENIMQNGIFDEGSGHDILFYENDIKHV